MSWSNILTVEQAIKAAEEQQEGCHALAQVDNIKLIHLSISLWKLQDLAPHLVTHQLKSEIILIFVSTVKFRGKTDRGLFWLVHISCQ